MCADVVNGHLVFEGDVFYGCFAESHRAAPHIFFSFLGFSPQVEVTDLSEEKFWTDICPHEPCPDELGQGFFGCFIGEVKLAGDGFDIPAGEFHIGVEQDFDGIIDPQVIEGDIAVMVPVRHLWLDWRIFAEKFCLW